MKKSFLVLFCFLSVLTGQDSRVAVSSYCFYRENKEHIKNYCSVVLPNILLNGLTPAPSQNTVMRVAASNRGEGNSSGESALKDDTGDFSDVVSLNVRTCGLVDSQQNLKGGSLPDYWAQRMIGSDLLREELEKFPPPQKDNWIVVLDAVHEIFGFHGVLVKNLISDKGPHAVLPKLAAGQVSLLETWSGGNAFRVIESLISKGNRPSFINHSYSWVNDSRYYEAFRLISPPTVLVTSAGNHFPGKLNPEKKKASKNLHTIIVGSLSPSGFVSNFSQSGREVHILAPSDDYIISTDAAGDGQLFGGTSGATPLVTGSLAGFEWLSGYHPSPEEAKILLEKTAVPTVHSHKRPQKNGVGLLNAYKLGRMGLLLREKCEDKESTCFGKEIKTNDRIYRFQLKEDLKGHLMKVFPECFSEREEELGGNCEERRKLFKSLSRAVLLNPKERELWKILGCIYKKGEFFEYGEALDRIALAGSSSRTEVISGLKSLVKKDEISKGLLRTVAGMVKRKEGIRIMHKYAEADDSWFLQREAVYAAGVIGGRAGIRVLQSLQSSPYSSVRGAVASVAGCLGNEEGTAIARRLQGDESFFVRGKALSAIKECSVKIHH